MQSQPTNSTNQPQQKKPPTQAEIIQGYNETKQKYTLFFQKALEIEQELVEYNKSIVANTLSGLSGNRRCFHKVGTVLVEKDLPTVKKSINVEIVNIKQTLDAIYKSMRQQEEILQQFEKRYGDIIKEVKKKQTDVKKQDDKKIQGVLV